MNRGRTKKIPKIIWSVISARKTHQLADNPRNRITPKRPWRCTLFGVTVEYKKLLRTRICHRMVAVAMSNRTSPGNSRDPRSLSKRQWSRRALPIIVFKQNNYFWKTHNFSSSSFTFLQYSFFHFFHYSVQTKSRVQLAKEIEIVKIGCQPRDRLTERNSFQFFNETKNIKVQY